MPSRGRRVTWIFNRQRGYPGGWSSTFSKNVKGSTVLRYSFINIKRGSR